MNDIVSWIITGAVALLVICMIIMTVAYWRMLDNQTYWSSLKQTGSLGLLTDDTDDTDTDTDDKTNGVDDKVSTYYPGIPWVTPTPMNRYVSNDTPVIGPEVLVGQSQRLRGAHVGYTPTKTSGLEVPGSDEFNQQVEAHNLRDLNIVQGKRRFASSQDIFRKKPVTDSLFRYVGDYSEAGPLQGDPLADNPWRKKSLREYVGVNYNDS